MKQITGFKTYETDLYAHISQFIRFSRAYFYVCDFSCRNKFLTAKLLKAIAIINFVSNFQSYCHHSGLVEKYNASLKTPLLQGISEPEFYGDLIYRLRKIGGSLILRNTS